MSFKKKKIKIKVSYQSLDFDVPSTAQRHLRTIEIRVIWNNKIGGTHKKYNLRVTHSLSLSLLPRIIFQPFSDYHHLHYFPRLCWIELRSSSTPHPATIQLGNQKCHSERRRWQKDDWLGWFEELGPAVCRGHIHSQNFCFNIYPDFSQHTTSSVH